MTVFDRVRIEVVRMAKFGVVGVAATGVHAGVALLALPHVASPFAANVAGFLPAFVVSFLGQALWTFGIRTGRGAAALRFFVIAASAFLVSNVVLGALERSGLLADWLALLIAIAIIPVCNFIAARFWAFRPAAGGGDT